jgi:hypothetical protein
MHDEEHETIGKRHVVTENPRLSIYGETPYGGLVYDTPSFDYDTKKGAQGAGAAVNKTGTYDKVKGSPVDSTRGSYRGGGPSNSGYDQVRGPAVAPQGAASHAGRSAIAQSIAAAGNADAARKLGTYDAARKLGTYDAAGKLGTYDAAGKLGTYDAARGVGTYGSATDPTYDVGTGTGADSVYSTIDRKSGAGIQQRIREAGQQDSYMQASLRGERKNPRVK